MSSHKIFNRNLTLGKIANILTLVRSLIGLLVIIFLIHGYFVIAWVLILVGGVTDVLDGPLARISAKGSSTWGARLDPLADKLLLLAPLLWLSANRVLPIWSVWILLSRELIVSAWRSNQKDAAPASVLGKIKTVLQFLSILLLMWPESIGDLSIVSNINSIGFILFWISLFFALASFIKYLTKKITYNPK